MLCAETKFTRWLSMCLSWFELYFSFNWQLQLGKECCVSFSLLFSLVVTNFTAQWYDCVWRKDGGVGGDGIRDGTKKGIGNQKPKEKWM